MLWFLSMTGVVCVYKSSSGTHCHRSAVLWNTGQIVNQVARVYRTGKAVSHSSEHTQRRPFIILKWERGYAAALYACSEQTLIYKRPLNQGRWIDWCHKEIGHVVKQFQQVLNTRINPNLLWLPNVAITGSVLFITRIPGDILEKVRDISQVQHDISPNPRFNLSGYH